MNKLTINKYKILITFFIFLILLATKFSFSQELYFCERYDENEGEIGKSDKFKISSSVCLITVMFKIDYTSQINVDEVILNVQKIDCGIYEFISETNYDVSSRWDYIYFSDVELETAGVYRVSLYELDEELIASGLVEIIYPPSVKDKRPSPNKK